MVLDNLAVVGKIGLVLFLVGSCFFVVGFSVPYWAQYGDTRFGLWQTCSKVFDACYSVVDFKTERLNLYDTDWFRGTQALACMALIVIIIDFFILFLYICGKPRKFLLISVILACAAATLAILAAVVFGSEIDKNRYIDLNWGFGFDIVGGCFLGGSAVCFLFEFCRRH